MKNILNNKIFVFILTFIFIVFFIFNSAFGYYDFEYEDESYRLGDNLTNFRYWFIGQKYNEKWGGTYFLFFGSDYPLYYVQSGNVTSVYSLDPINGKTGSYCGEFYSTDIMGMTYDMMETCTKDDLRYWGYPSSSGRFSDLNLIYANHDVLNEEGEVVFQGAPLPPQVVEPMKIQQVEEIPQEVIKIVKMIIPTFLMIFGTLLVLYLIKSKNLLSL